MDDFRTEYDTMGEILVPAGSYYGAQTQRAVLNFPVSGIRFSSPFIRALGLVKKAAAEANVALGTIPEDVGSAIVAAASEVISGSLDSHFPVDIFQTGSGTSTNMNANEVIANRAIQLLGGRIGDGSVHPNDHVNCSQSSNDVIPTAMHVSASQAIHTQLIPSLQHLQSTLAARAMEFDDVVKTGRTHLQDAVPIRVGQEFSGYAAMAGKALGRLESPLRSLSELPIGGTAVGTGLNAPDEFPGMVVARISDWTEISFREAENRFEAIAAKDAVVETSGVLKGWACSLMKIANDIRWLGSGPRCGIGEIRLPPTQPGSSIMPGKVNPVIAESVTMVCAQVIGNDVAISIGGQSGNFELNVMMPVMAHNLLQSIGLLANSCRLFSDKCISGIVVDRERCEELVERSLAMVTALAPAVGYEKAAGIAKEAYLTGKTIRQVALEQGVLPPDELEVLLDARRQTGSVDS